MVTGTGVPLHARVDPPGSAIRYRWTVDGRVVRESDDERFDYLPIDPGRHRISVVARAGEREVGSGGWSVLARAPVEPRPPAPPPAPSPAARTPPEAPASPPVVEASRSGAVLDTAPPSTGAAKLSEEEVRRWLQDYAAAWSRKDIEALRRMGQVRSGSEVDRLDRYFHSIEDLRVEVRVVTLHIDGERAAVEFERTDTVTDPAGQRRELRLPPFRKEIERSGQGLRFAEVGGAR